MDNAFIFNRAALDELEDRLKTRIKGACLTVMRYMILAANHSDGMYRNVAVKRGQILCGRNQIQEKTGLSDRTIRSAIEVLKKHSELTAKTQNKATSKVTSKVTNQVALYTVVNYGSYDGASDEVTSKATSKATTEKEEEEKEQQQLQAHGTSLGGTPNDPPAAQAAEPVVDALEAELRDYWDNGYGKSEGPYPKQRFDAWRQTYGDELVGRVCRDVYLSGKMPQDAVAYIASILKAEAQKSARRPQPKDGVDEMRDLHRSRRKAGGHE